MALKNHHEVRDQLRRMLEEKFKLPADEQVLDMWSRVEREVSAGRPIRIEPDPESLPRGFFSLAGPADAAIEACGIPRRSPAAARPGHGAPRTNVRANASNRHRSSPVVAFHSRRGRARPSRSVGAASNCPDSRRMDRCTRRTNPHACSRRWREGYGRTPRWAVGKKSWSHPHGSTGRG
jgi:hypothetical protein